MPISPVQDVQAEAKEDCKSRMKEGLIDTLYAQSATQRLSRLLPGRV